MNQLENIISFINRNYDALFSIQVLSIFLLFSLLLFLWNITRKKYRNLRGEIPADALNNYLDSLRQNSNAANSAPMTNIQKMTPEVNQGTPSVMPLSKIEASGQSVAITSGVSTEELNERNAEIAQLRSMLSSKSNQISELENKLVEESIKSSTSGATTEADPKVLAKVKDLEAAKKELEEKLKVYEVIDDDIAELSKLRKENEELRKSLGQDAPAPKAAVIEPEAEVEITEMEEPEAVAEEVSEGEGDLEDMLGAMNEEPVVDEATEADPMEAFSGGSDDMDDMLGGGSDPVDDMLGGGESDPMEDMLGGSDAVAEDAPQEEQDDAPTDAADDGKTVEVKETDSPDDLLSQFEELLG